VTPEWLFYNGNVVPMTGPADRATAFAVVDGRLTAVGSDADLRPLASIARTAVDLRGATVLPGLIDTHVHLVRTGLAMLGPFLPPARTVSDLVASVQQALCDFPGETPVICHGGGVRRLDREPRRQDLDAVAGPRAVLVSDPSAHVCLVNSAALEHLSLDGVVGVQRDDTSSPTGVLVTWANKAARHWFHSQVPRTQIEHGLSVAAASASRRGVTTIHAMDGGDYLGHDDVSALLNAQSKLPLDTVIYAQVLDLDRVAAWGLPRVGGCILLDGAYGEHTAALSEPYADASTRGVLFHSDHEIAAFVSGAHQRGWQVTVHAQGDAAIEQVLRAYEQALEAHTRVDHRHRIEHCGLPTQDQLERIARLGIGLGMQPVFARAHPSLMDLFGPDRVKRRHRYRAIKQLGIVVGGGSDADSSPIDPLAGVQAAATLDAARRLTAYEALELFTTNAAFLAFEEHTKGILKPGAWADFVVLASDPLAVPVEQIASVPVQQTWFRGRRVFGAPTEAGPIGGSGVEEPM
jgi:predicted amidohydrolase YtcJ